MANIEVNRFSSQSQHLEGDAAAPRRAPDAGSAEEFAARCRDGGGHGDGREGGEGGHRGQHKDEGEMPQAGGLSGLMGELWGARMGREPASAAVAPPPAPAAADANELNAQLVSRILVSAPAQGGDPEVRIKLSEALLPGAEVRLSRGTDGMLSVTLVADRPEAFQTLVAAQGSLKSALEAQDKSQVRVAVEHAAAQDGSGGDPNRRSATYAAYPADGGAQ